MDTQGSGPPTKNPAGRIFREIKILPGSGEQRPARREARQDFFSRRLPGPARAGSFFRWASGPEIRAGFLFAAGAAGPGPGRIFGGRRRLGRGPGRIFRGRSRPQRQNPLWPGLQERRGPLSRAGFFASGTRKILPGPGHVRLAGRGARQDLFFAPAQIKILPGSGGVSLVDFS